MVQVTFKRPTLVIVTQKSTMHAGDADPEARVSQCERFRVARVIKP
jgi:hypothetical protein